LEQVIRNLVIAFQFTQGKENPLCASPTRIRSAKIFKKVTLNPPSPFAFPPCPLLSSAGDLFLHLFLKNKSLFFAHNSFIFKDPSSISLFDLFLRNKSSIS